MAEFLIHRDPLQESSSLVLKSENQTYGSEKPYDDPCSNCPVKNTEIAGGCTTLIFSSYTKDVRAIMPTKVEPSCGVINDRNNTAKLGNDEYDSQTAMYEDKKLIVDLRQEVRRVVKGQDGKE